MTNRKPNGRPGDLRNRRPDEIAFRRFSFIGIWNLDPPPLHFGPYLAIGLSASRGTYHSISKLHLWSPTRVLISSPSLSRCTYAILVVRHFCFRSPEQVSFCKRTFKIPPYTIPSLKGGIGHALHTLPSPMLLSHEMIPSAFSLCFSFHIGASLFPFSLPPLFPLRRFRYRRIPILLLCLQKYTRRFCFVLRSQIGAFPSANSWRLLTAVRVYFHLSPYQLGPSRCPSDFKNSPGDFSLLSRLSVIRE